MSVRFEENRGKVIAALEDATIAYLHGAAGEIVAATKRNVPSKGNWFTQQKNAWQYKVDESKKEAVIGNPLEPSLWTEFGTGEFAINDDGRKGYWVYVKSDSSPTGSYAYKGGKAYTLEEAKQVMAMLRSDGLDAHITKGQKAHRPLHKAFTTLKPKLIRRAEQELSARMK